MQSSNDTNSSDDASTDHDVHVVYSDVDEVNCPDTTMSTWRYCPIDGSDLQESDDHDFTSGVPSPVIDCPSADANPTTQPERWRFCPYCGQEIPVENRAPRADDDGDASTGDVDTETPRAIPFYIIQSAMETAPDDAEYVVVRSDNDYVYADSLPEANEQADELRAETDATSPITHTVQVIELQEVPPAA